MSSERHQCPVCGWWVSAYQGRIPLHHQRRVMMGADGKAKIYKTNERCPGEGESVAAGKQENPA